MPVTEKLCEIIVNTRYEHLGEDVIKAGRRLLLDGLATAVAGANSEPGPRILAEHLREQGSAPVAVALGMGFRLGPVPAALLNGVSMNVLDFEPIWLPMTHTVSPTLPVALALAEKLGADGRDVVTALIKGIEIQGWICEASGHVEERDMKFHPPGVVGPMGAVVTAAHLLKLDAGQLANALGIVSSRCGGLFANNGTMTKSTHYGYSGSLGLEAALLAARGFTGNMAVFDAVQGYANAFLPPSFQPEMLLQYGKPFRVIKPGFWIKIFPSKYTTHFGITAGLLAHPQIPSEASIKAVRLTTPVSPTSDRPKPASGLAGKFSLQYTLAAALLDGEVKISTFTDKRLNKPDMQSLLSKITLTMSPELSSTQGNGDKYTELAVDLIDGQTIRERCNRPKGGYGGPPITDAEHMVKVKDCLAIGMSPLAVENCIDLASRIETLDSARVKEMIRLASGSE